MSPRKDKERQPAWDRLHGVMRKASEHLFLLIRSPWRAFKFLCFSVGLFVLTLSVVAGLFVASFFSSLPDFDKLTWAMLQAQAQSRVKAQRIDKKKAHRWVPLNAVSRDLLYSIVLSEDATFFEHDGIDIDAIREAIAENLTQGKSAFGASTISQQVVKNLFLTQEKSYIRKLKEFLITRDMEAHLTKNQVMELYLNIAEFGPDIFGVHEASRSYFRKTPAAMNAAEGAFLALMLPSPKRRYYSIYENRHISPKNQRKIRRVLRDMLYEEFITEKEFRNFVNYPYFPSTRRPARRR